MKIFKVNTGSNTEVAVKVSDEGKIRFWYNDYREGGYYIPESDTETEIGKIFYRFGDYDWLEKICKELNLNSIDVVKAGINYYIKRHELEADELDDRISSLKSQLTELNKKLIKDRNRLRLLR